MLKNINGYKRMSGWISAAVVMALCVNILCDLLFPNCAAKAGSNTVKITPDTQTVSVGTKFDVKVLLTTVEQSDSFGCILQWKGSGRIKCTGAEEGTFYKTQGTTMLVGDAGFDPYQGWIADANGDYQAFSVALIGAKAPAAEAEVFILHFVAEGAGDVNIQFLKKDRQNKDLTLLGSSFIDKGQINSKPLTITPTDGKVTVAKSGSSSSTGSGDKPNLVIDTIDPKKVSNNYSINYTVRNKGGVKSGDFRVGLYVNDNVTPYATENVKTLEAGGTYSGKFDKYTLQNLGKEDVLKVWADDNKKLEQDDTDKHYDTWPYIDLIVSSISANWIDQGKTYEVSYKVKNIGSKEAGQSNTAIQVNGGKKDYKTCKAVAAGEEKEDKFGPVTLGASGTDTFQICADAMTAVTEDRADNNCKDFKWPDASAAGQTGTGQPQTGQTGTGGKTDNNTGNADNSAQIAVNTASPQIPETRPATPGITISWEYIGGLIGLVFLVGLLGFVFGRLMSDRQSDY